MNLCKGSVVLYLVNETKITHGEFYLPTVKPVT
jgi:hypothetical protein